MEWRVTPNTQNRQSILCITAITSVLWHNTKHHHLQKMILTLKRFITTKSISHLLLKKHFDSFCWNTYLTYCRASVDIINRLPFSCKLFLLLNNGLTSGIAADTGMQPKAKQFSLIPGLLSIVLLSTRQRIFSLPPQLFSALLYLFESFLPHPLLCRLNVRTTSESCWWTRLRSWPVEPMLSSHYVLPERYG